MTTIDEFLQEVRLINWFEHSKEAENKYHVIHSIFEAYDDWNAQMLKTWEPHTFSLERMAIKQIGDAQIDKVFSTVSSEIGDAIWKNGKISRKDGIWRKKAGWKMRCWTWLNAMYHGRA